MSALVTDDVGTASAPRRLSPDPTRRGTLKVTRRFLRPHRTLLAAGLLTSALAALLLVAVPVLVGRLVDALNAGDGTRATTMAWIAVACAVAQVAVGGLGRSLLVRAGEYTVRDVREVILDRYTRVPLRFLERHPTGELLQRGSGEVAALSMFVREAMPELVVTVATLLVTVVVLASQSLVLLAVLLVSFLPFGFFLLQRFRAVAPAAYAQEASAEAEVAAEVAEHLRARSLLHAVSDDARRHFTAGLAGPQNRVVAAQMRTAILQRWVHAMALVEGATLALLLVGGAWLVARDTVTIGVMVTFVLAGATLFSGFADLSGQVAGLEEAATRVARLADLLDVTDVTDVTADAPGAPRSLPSTSPRSLLASTSTSARPGAALSSDAASSGSAVSDEVSSGAASLSGPTLELAGVWFGYGEDAVLRGVDLTVHPGQRTVVVGRSGAGKSTLVKVLAGLYPPDRGSVTCAGQALHELDTDERARLVALVPQQVQLAPGSLAEELRLVRPSASDAELRAAAATLGLEDWIDSLPDGLDTAVGVGGPLSAGERQLVALVRIALTDSRILVLDEATADIDPRTAQLVERALDHLAADRAVIAVAHAEQTIARWGTVLRLSDGRLEPAPAA